MPRIRIGEIYQIGIVVKDAWKAAEHYWETLGVGPWQIGSLRPPAICDVTVHGKPVEVSVRGATAQSGPVQLELIEPFEGPSIWKEFLDEKGGGLHHVQSRVEDPDAVLASFKEMGVKVLMSGRVGNNWFYYMDTEPLLGVIYEFGKKVGPPIMSLSKYEGTYPP